MINKITKMARSLLYIEDDLTQRLDYSTGEHPTVDDFEIWIFEQVWGDTSLGFGGIGGQAMTSAPTFAFIPNGVNQNCFVYFGSRFAYAVPFSEVFYEDLKGHCLVSVAKSGKYNKAGDACV